MRDYLKEYCSTRDIKLKYTKNKSSVLSISNERETPLIRIHKMFKNCSEDTADKIIKYYEFYQGSYSIIKFIQDYVQQYYSTMNYEEAIAGGLHTETSTKNSIQIIKAKDIKSGSKYAVTCMENKKSSLSDKCVHENESDDIYFKKEAAERKVVDVIITKNNSIMFTFKPQKYSAIHGTVKLPDGKPAKSALVKLFYKQANSDELLPGTSKFTNNKGEFAFELSPGEYVIKVFYY